MMAETIKLPVIGPTKKTYVYVGGALIVGFVGYAYWSRSREEAPPPSELPEEIAPEDRENPPTFVGAEDIDLGTEGIISTNAQWATQAIARLSEVGYDPVFASAAIGKFLLRQGLTTDEKVMVQAALGMLGPPPNGGPWQVIDVPVPTPTPTLPAPTGLRIANRSRTRLLVHWNRVTGATGYTVYLNGRPRARTTGNAVTLGSTVPLRPNTRYRIAVYASSPTARSPLSPTIIGETVR
jgi:hypothetical protein